MEEKNFDGIGIIKVFGKCLGIEISLFVLTSIICANNCIGCFHATLI